MFRECNWTEQAMVSRVCIATLPKIFKVFVGPRSILWGHWYPLFWTWDDLPMGFKARVGLSSPALFCHLHTMIFRVISGCQDRIAQL